MRRLAIVLVASAAVALVAGCSDGDEGADRAPTTATTPVTVADPGAAHGRGVTPLGTVENDARPSPTPGEERGVDEVERQGHRAGRVSGP